MLINSKLTVISNTNNLFDITFNSDLNENVYLSVYNSLGQKLKTRPITKSNEDTYKIILDMQEASSGIYIIKVDNISASTFKAVRIIVR